MRARHPDDVRCRLAEGMVSLPVRLHKLAEGFIGGEIAGRNAARESYEA